MRRASLTASSVLKSSVILKTLSITSRYQVINRNAGLSTLASPTKIGSDCPGQYVSKVAVDLVFPTVAL